MHIYAPTYALAKERVMAARDDGFTRLPLLNRVRSEVLVGNAWDGRAITGTRCPTPNPSAAQRIETAIRRSRSYPYGIASVPRPMRAKRARRAETSLPSRPIERRISCNTRTTPTYNDFGTPSAVDVITGLEVYLSAPELRKMHSINAPPIRALARTPVNRSNRFSRDGVEMPLPVSGDILYLLIHMHNLYAEVQVDSVSLPRPYSKVCTLTFYVKNMCRPERAFSDRYILANVRDAVARQSGRAAFDGVLSPRPAGVVV